MNEYKYIKWYRGSKTPKLFFEVEQNNEHYATRMAKLSIDGVVSKIIPNEKGTTEESYVPNVEEINHKPDNYAEYISKEEFEAIYNSEQYNLEVNADNQSKIPKRAKTCFKLFIGLTIVSMVDSLFYFLSIIPNIIICIIGHISISKYKRSNPESDTKKYTIAFFLGIFILPIIGFFWAIYIFIKTTGGV